MASFVPSTVERAINDLQEKILPLKPFTIKGRPANRHAIAFSSDCELAIASEDSLHIYFPEFPNEEDSDDELTEEEEEEERANDAAESGKGNEDGRKDDDEQIVLPDGSTFKLSLEQRKAPRIRKHVFFRRPHDDPHTPMLELKEAHELDKRDDGKAQYREYSLRFPVLLPDPRINIPLFRAAKAQYPLWHLKEWRGDVIRRKNQPTNLESSQAGSLSDGGE